MIEKSKPSKPMVYELVENQTFQKCHLISIWSSQCLLIFRYLPEFRFNSNKVMSCFYDFYQKKRELFLWYGRFFVGLDDMADSDWSNCKNWILKDCRRLGPHYLLLWNAGLFVYLFIYFYFFVKMQSWFLTLDKFFFKAFQLQFV